jgi:8-oxo-dGTP pyrophosphatase MutT (NUDIX family)
VVTLPRCFQLFSLSLQKKDRLGINPPKGFQRAGVLIPFFLRNNEWFILFTRRTENVRNHPGQISFPGGRVEASDENIVHTALRETHEEIGIEAVKVLGCINDIVTISMYIVTPVVGVFNEGHEIAKNINHGEIDYILEVPLRHLAEPNNFSLKTREWQGNMFFVPFFDYENEEIWGATGRILVDLLNRLSEVSSKCQSELFGQSHWKHLYKKNQITNKL